MKKATFNKRGRVILLALGAVLLASACSVTAPPGYNDDEGTVKIKQVLFNHYFSGSLVGGIDTMVGRLNADSPDFKVNAVPIDHEAYKLLVPEMLKSGKPADMYSYWAGARTQAVSPYLQPLDDLWEAQGLDAVFPAFITETACTYDGHQYLIPITQHYVGLVCNKSVFNELGIAMPENWEQLLAACEKLKGAGITPIALGSKDRWPAQFWFDYIQVRTQPLDFREALMTGKASYTDPRVVHIFEIWKDLVDRGYFNADANETTWDTGAGDRVYNGDAGMTLMGTWIVGYYQDKPDPWVLGEDYEIIPFPVIDPEIPGCSIGPIDGIMIPVNAHNREEAKRVVAYFAEKETQKAMSSGSGAFAPSLEVEDAFYTVAQQALLKTIRNTPGWAFAFDLATPPEAAEIGLNTFVDFMEFPEAYRYLLEETQRQMVEAFGQ